MRKERTSAGGFPLASFPACEFAVINPTIATKNHVPRMRTRIERLYYKTLLPILEARLLVACGVFSIQLLG